MTTEGRSTIVDTGSKPKFQLYLLLCFYNKVTMKLVTSNGDMHGVGLCGESSAQALLPGSKAVRE